MLIEVSPKMISDVKIHQTNIILKTLNEEVLFPLNIIVTNSAPYFIN